MGHCKRLLYRQLSSSLQAVPGPLVSLILQCSQFFFFKTVSFWEPENASYPKAKILVKKMLSFNSSECKHSQLFQLWGILHRKYFRFSNSIINRVSVESKKDKTSWERSTLTHNILLLLIFAHIHCNSDFKKVIRVLVLS